jgi:hypothetical protein
MYGLYGDAAYSVIQGEWDTEIAMSRTYLKIADCCRSDKNVE